MFKGPDNNPDAQFKKLFIYPMKNVSILFADIKVRSIVIVQVTLGRRWEDARILTPTDGSRLKFALNT